MTKTKVALAALLALASLLAGVGQAAAQHDTGTVNAVLKAETTKVIGTVNVAAGQTIGATQSGTWTVQPGNTANTTAWLVTGTGGSFPIPANSSVNVSQINGVTPLMGAGNGGTGSLRVNIASDQVSIPTTQAAFTTLTAGQQAVTTTATALPTVTSSRVCVKNLFASTQTVYFGQAGVTTSTGQELSPGDSYCAPLTNVNKVVVIAGSTGSTVGYDALN